jgi:aminoglycoside phosphotransferase (APT) family kinase protein
LIHLPIRTMDFSRPEDSNRHDSLTTLVELMLQLHRLLAAARKGHERTVLQHQIEATDGQIDRLVNEIYGHTEEEIEIVEWTYL